ncbi:MAG: MjaI family restriction endonuclease [Halolamina sp.]|uniref:MjaI family restriction endonuclease n=1 Tax=Halolamina sp. TaxID=1940283 RepID=UPI002FC2B6D0
MYHSVRQYQNSQGTRPATVGQLNEILDEYNDEYPEGDFEDWKQFYYEQNDGDEKIEEAADKVYEMVDKMRDAAEQIDRDMLDRWVTDLVLYIHSDVLCSTSPDLRRRKTG